MRRPFLSPVAGMLALVAACAFGAMACSSDTASPGSSGSNGTPGSSGAPATKNFTLKGKAK
jgi:hypothetical protein